MNRHRGASFRRKLAELLIDAERLLGRMLLFAIALSTLAALGVGMAFLVMDVVGS